MSNGADFSQQASPGTSYTLSYPKPLFLQESAAGPASEMQAQAVWFEQLLRGPLRTDDGREFEVIQPGLWNHGAGPDFHRAAIRWLGGESLPGSSEKPLDDIEVGDVEVHMEPSDWVQHRHHEDAAYENTLLHVVWNAPAHPFYPATKGFRCIPQVILSQFTAAPWEELLPVVAGYGQTSPLPESKAGRCHAQMTGLPENAVLDLVRSAGMVRLRQRSQRWLWRERLTSPEQALFEALAEALGFHKNQIPMRLLAQRLPYSFLRGLPLRAKMAHLFGLSGFLPGESTRNLSEESRAWLTPLWEIWWKERTRFQHAILPRDQWQLAGQRPLNRPERRIAALAHLVEAIPLLRKALLSANATAFAERLFKVSDPFWDHRATLTSGVIYNGAHLIGEERIQNILTNVFWPLVSWHEPLLARDALLAMPAAENRNARIATQRVLQGLVPAKMLRSSLVQQGLLQIFKDYCQTDCSACEKCTFPEAVNQGN
jgi:hypothetical protein